MSNTSANAPIVSADVTHDPAANAGLPPHGRTRFADHGDLAAHLAAVGAVADGAGVRGKVSRRGKDFRPGVGGLPPILRDPVLDAIGSPDGTIVIGDETIALRNTVMAAAPALKHTGNVNGAERWASDDGSLVEYRWGKGRLRFHAWKKSFGYWSMGAEISVSDTSVKFQRAEISSRYFMSVSAPCQLVKEDSDSDRNDTYVDEYEWGIHAQQPERVSSACRALWHNAFFADVVTAGGGCEAAAKNIPWDMGEPTEWRTRATVLNLAGDWTAGGAAVARISIDVQDLTVDMSAFHRPKAHGSIVDWDKITVKFPDDGQFTGTLEAPRRIRWSNNTVWTKVVPTIIDLNGRWSDGSNRSVLISEGSHDIKIDMSDFDRPTATGTIVNGSTIKVKFPDDHTFTGQLQAPGTIIWSNGTRWTRHS